MLWGMAFTSSRCQLSSPLRCHNILCEILLCTYDLGFNFFFNCPHLLWSDWEPLGRDIFLFTFHMVCMFGGQEIEVKDSLLNEWINQYNWKVSWVNYFKEDNTHFTSVKTSILILNIFLYVRVIKMNMKWYWIVEPSLVTKVSSGQRKAGWKSLFPHWQGSLTTLPGLWLF